MDLLEQEIKRDNLIITGVSAIFAQVTAATDTRRGAVAKNQSLATTTDCEFKLCKDNLGVPITANDYFNSFSLQSTPWRDSCSDSRPFH